MDEAQKLGMVMIAIFTVAFCVVMAYAAYDAAPAVWEWVMNQVHGVLSRYG